MNVLPLEICERLVEMGCNPDHNMAYDRVGNIRHLPHSSAAGIALDEFGPYTPAFIFQDFCGISEQSKRNTLILWPNSMEASKLTSDEAQHRMLDMVWDEWVEFMKEAINEKC